MEKYIAIIADVKGSRAVLDRGTAQENILETLKNINEKYKDVIASKFIVSFGDSFQGLLRNGTQTMNIIMEFDLELYPLKIRYGIGIGEIGTRIYRENSNIVDGKAYHMARNSLDAVKKSEDSKEKIITNIKVSKEGEELLLINSLLSLLSILKNNWTENQVQVINKYVEKNYEQVSTADELNRNQSTISRSLEKSNFYSFKNSVDTLNISIENERIN